MKKFILLATILFAVSQSLFAQNDFKTVYPVVASFRSICCGVPSDTAISKFITSFKKKYKIKKITADEIGPVGKEGEYYLAFKLKELTKKQAAEFISKIQKVQKLESDPGSLNFELKKRFTQSEIPSRASWKKTIFK